MLSLFCGQLMLSRAGQWQGDRLHAFFFAFGVAAEVQLSVFQTIALRQWCCWVAQDGKRAQVVVHVEEDGLIIVVIRPAYATHGVQERTVTWPDVALRQAQFVPLNGGQDFGRAVFRLGV